MQFYLKPKFVCVLALSVCLNSCICLPRNKSFYHSIKRVRIHSPGHAYTWVQVVELGGTQCNLFVFFSVSRLHLHLQQLLLTTLHCCLLPLHQPDRKQTQRQVKQSQETSGRSMAGTVQCASFPQSGQAKISVFPSVFSVIQRQLL